MINPTRAGITADLFSAPMAGIRKSVQDMDDASEAITQGDVTPGNIAGQIQAEILFKANAISLRTASEVIGSLLDEKA